MNPAHEGARAFFPGVPASHGFPQEQVGGMSLLDGMDKGAVPPGARSAGVVDTSALGLDSGSLGTQALLQGGADLAGVPGLEALLLAQLGGNAVVQPGAGAKDGLSHGGLANARLSPGLGDNFADLAADLAAAAARAAQGGGANGNGLVLPGGGGNASGLIKSYYGNPQDSVPNQQQLELHAQLAELKNLERDVSLQAATAAAVRAQCVATLAAQQRVKTQAQQAAAQAQVVANAHAQAAAAAEQQQALLTQQLAALGLGGTAAPSVAPVPPPPPPLPRRTRDSASSSPANTHPIVGPPPPPPPRHLSRSSSSAAGSTSTPALSRRQGTSVGNAVPHSMRSGTRSTGGGVSYDSSSRYARTLSTGHAPRHLPNPAAVHNPGGLLDAATNNGRGGAALPPGVPAGLSSGDTAMMMQLAHILSEQGGSGGLESGAVLGVVPKGVSGAQSFPQQGQQPGLGHGVGGLNSMFVTTPPPPPPKRAPATSTPASVSVPVTGINSSDRFATLDLGVGFK